MTVCCPTFDSSFAVIARPNTGSSTAAGAIERLVRDGFKHYTAPRMERLIPEIEELVLNSAQKGNLEAGAISVDQETADAAIEFALSLPRSMPAPEVAPDSDGEISFDWIGPSGRMFSVSINRNRRIAYAGRFGEKSKIRGTEQLSEGCPQEIIRGIARAIS
jgi:hypothetical protein